MRIDIPSKKSEYLNFGEGATIEKVKEIQMVLDMTKDFVPSEIGITILDSEFGNKVERKLSDFVPNEISIDGTIQKIEYIDNLLYTIELNPPEEVILSTPDGLEYFLVKEEEHDEVLDECYDVSDKLRDCIDTIRAGNKLDSTQNAFLKMHNIIEK